MMVSNRSGFYQAWKHRVARIGRLLGAFGWLLARLDGNGRRNAFLAFFFQACSIGLKAVFLVSIVEVLKGFESGKSNEVSSFGVGAVLGPDYDPLVMAGMIGIVGALSAAAFLLSEVLVLRVAKEQHLHLAWTGLRWLAQRDACEASDVKRLIVASRMSALGTRTVLTLPTSLITFFAVAAVLIWLDPAVVFVALIAGIPCVVAIYYLNIRAARMQRKYLEHSHETPRRFRELTTGVDLPTSSSEFETPEVSVAISSLWSRIRILAEARAVSFVALALVLSAVFAVFMESDGGTGAVEFLAVIVLLRVGLSSFGQLSANLTAFSRYFKEVEWLVGLQRSTQGGESRPNKLTVDWQGKKGTSNDDEEDDSEF